MDSPAIREDSGAKGIAGIVLRFLGVIVDTNGFSLCRAAVKGCNKQFAKIVGFPDPISKGYKVRICGVLFVGVQPNRFFYDI